MWMDWLMSMASIFGTLLGVTASALIFALVYVKVLGNSFNKASFKASKEANKHLRFEDVLGVDEAKREAKEVVDFLKRGDALKAIGAKAPRGILMVGASRIRKLYAAARKHKAAIVFIDEIDALARARSTNMFGGQESNNTLNAFLVELDGFGRDSNVITIGATNMEESLDAALLRPGRFDRKVYVGLPSLEGREAILSYYLKRVKVSQNIDVRAIARATALMSGADLAAVVNEASILAVRDGREQLRQSDLAKGIERLGIGAEQSKTISVQERRIIAIHEAGHAVVGYFSASPKRLHKVSIIPTGRQALGYTWSVHTEDRHLTSHAEFICEIAGLFGGRLAEETVFGAAQVTSGAHSDLQRASQLAETMVLDLGFAPGFPGAYRQAVLSEDTKRQLDEAVGVFLNEGRALARAILSAHEAELDSLATALLAQEMLYEEDIQRLWQTAPALPLEVQPSLGDHAA
jgi:cell division protease FtsH